MGTGESHTVRELVELAFKSVGIDDWKKYVVIDPQYKRPAEVPNLRAKPDKAFKLLKWKPKMTFDKLIKTMVEADLERNKKKTT